jgi:putative addiction module component (TIGR02574 family)
MGHDQLLEQLMALPLAERVDLAQALWQSIDEAPEAVGDDREREAVALAFKRDAELSDGTVTGRSHEDVMRAAVRALQCD